MALPAVHITPEEYLELERAATDAKHEYFNGEMREQEPKNLNQCRIASNTLLLLSDQLSERHDCWAVNSSLRVCATMFCGYPSVSAGCRTPVFFDAHDDALINPTVVIDVVRSRFDRSCEGTRFSLYRTIPTLQDYLVVAQDVMHVEHHQRQPQQRWLLTDFRAPNDTIELAGVPARLSLTDLTTALPSTHETLPLHSPAAAPPRRLPAAAGRRRARSRRFV